MVGSGGKKTGKPRVMKRKITRGLGQCPEVRGHWNSGWVGKLAPGRKDSVSGLPSNKHQLKIMLHVFSHLPEVSMHFIGKGETNLRY